MKAMASIVAGIVIALMTISSSSAEMVNIGMGQMDSSEFAALKAMVAGHSQPATSEISTPLGRPERYGMVEMTTDAYESLRDRIAGRSIDSAQPVMAAEPVQMMDIGTGEMPQDEFIALKHMVEGKDAIVFGHLAAFLP